MHVHFNCVGQLLKYMWVRIDIYVRGLACTISGEIRENQLTNRKVRFNTLEAQKYPVRIFYANKKEARLFLGQIFSNTDIINFQRRPCFQIWSKYFVYVN